MSIDKLDYGDYHKFKVSLGVACIIAAFIVPWVFLREPFDLMLESDQLAKLNESARELIAYRLAFAQWLIWLVPFLSAALLVLGLVLVFRGLHQWKSIQHWFDQEQRLKVEKLAKEIKQMTPIEIKEKAEAEITDGDRPEISVGPADSVNDTMKTSESATNVRRYLDIESQLSRKIEQCLDSDYDVLPKRRLGKVEYDLILAAHSGTASDRVVEIKFAAKNFGRHWVVDNVLKVIMATELYSKGTKRKALPAILFVSPEDLLSRKNTSDYKLWAAREANRLGSELAIEFIAEENLQQLDCERVRSMLIKARE
jgi:hypothetical protein